MNMKFVLIIAWLVSPLAVTATIVTIICAQDEEAWGHPEKLQNRDTGNKTWVNGKPLGMREARCKTRAWQGGGGGTIRGS
jgi:hypothetical protein